MIRVPHDPPATPPMPMRPSPPARALLASLALLALLARAAAQDAPEDAPGPAPFVQELPGTTVTIELVPIPGGTLALRDPETLEPRGEVEVAPFYLARTETTWDAYDVLVYRFDLPQDAPEVDGVSRPTKPYIAADRGFGHAGYPAVSISARGAEAFCEWLSLRTGRRFRLPTEAEWEWACRAGAAEPWFGATADELEELAWIRTNSGLKTHPVGKKPASPWGLHDVLGNVGEWCRTAEGGHVIRGGSYAERASEVGPLSRRVPTPAWNANDPQIPKSVWWLTDGPFCGFRVLCELDPASGAPARGAAEATPPAGSGGGE